MLRTLGNRHSVFPFDCSANCWGVVDVSVYLKADRSNYTRSPFSIFHPLRCCTLSMDEFGISYRINLPLGFLHFSLSHSFRRDF